MRSTLSRSPTAACSVPSRSTPTARAAFLPVDGVHVAAELADPDLAVALGDVAGKEDQVAGAHERHVGAGGNRQRRQGDVEVGEAVVDRGHGAVGHGGRAQIVHPWPLHFGRCEHRRPASRLAALMLAWLARRRGAAAGALRCGRCRSIVGVAVGRPAGAALRLRLAPAGRRRRRAGERRRAACGRSASPAPRPSLRLGDDARPRARGSRPRRHRRRRQPAAGRAERAALPLRRRRRRATPGRSASCRRASRSAGTAASTRTPRCRSRSAS